MRTFVARSMLVLLCLPCTPALGDPGADKNNLIYHIFIRSFRDSNGDGIGDLKGITERLDEYLNDGKPETDHDLEVGILWLMPLFPTKSYHGYDVINYREINPEYGTMADLTNLVEAAHARGVRVILDLPINHTSDKHPWFTAAIAGPSSPFREYYHFRPDDSHHQTAPWHRADGSSSPIRYKGIFSARMPDLNFYHEPVRRDLKEIATFWLDKGIDGWTPPTTSTATRSDSSPKTTSSRTTTGGASSPRTFIAPSRMPFWSGRYSTGGKCCGGIRGASTASWTNRL